MKARLFFALLPLALGLAVYIPEQLQSQSPTPVHTPFTIRDEELAKLTDEDMAKTEHHKQALEKQHDEALDKVAEVAAAQGGSLSDASKATADAKGAFAEYKKETLRITDERNVAVASLAHVVKELHKLKWILSGLWSAFVAALIGIIIIKLPLVLKPYSLYVAAAGLAIAAAGTTYIWIHY